MKNSEMLELTISTFDFPEITVAQFLIKLLQTLWEEGENFNSKRPFGNSCWDYNLAIAIGVAGGFPIRNEGTDEDPEWVLEDLRSAISKISELIGCLVLSCSEAIA